MNADYRGFGPGRGPSPGPVAPLSSNTRAAGGGGHGGRGGRGSNQFVSATSYDSFYFPSKFGSGGGAGHRYSGGSGGGKLIFNVSYMLRLEGKISANGESGDGQGKEGNVN